jgi:hypothetical protein
MTMRSAISDLNRVPKVERLELSRETVQNLTEDEAEAVLAGMRKAGGDLHRLNPENGRMATTEGLTTHTTGPRGR